MSKVAFTAPHYKAAEIGLDFLQQGANAVDAMIAAASAISVCYPHMNGIGGDGFWLIHPPGEKPIAIDACGYAGLHCAAEKFQPAQALPSRGSHACITMAGTVSGWQKARALMADHVLTNSYSTDRFAIKELLAPAIALAKNGVEVSESLVSASQKLIHDLSTPEQDNGSIACLKQFSHKSEKAKSLRQPLVAGENLKNKELAGSLEQLAHAGLEDFYHGDLAKHFSQYFNDSSSLLTSQDFADYDAQNVHALEKNIRFGTLYNLPPPTQGLVSILILSIYDRLYQEHWTEADSAHYLIEASKRAFVVRDKFLGDPSRIPLAISEILQDEYIEKLSLEINDKASDWPFPANDSDTVWMGCCDKNGIMVSFIQSLYWEFGAGVMIPGTGIVWNNRGSSFSLQNAHPNVLTPRLKPFHTLNPAFFQADNGDRMVYGTMGGEGQPQTQAALFSRYMYHQFSLEDAVSRGRWLLGRTWGAVDSDLKMEQDMVNEIGPALKKRGHRIKPMASLSEVMGHAGAIVMRGEESIECVTDPRSDGRALTAEI